VSEELYTAVTSPLNKESQI